MSSSPGSPALEKKESLGAFAPAARVVSAAPSVPNNADAAGAHTSSLGDPEKVTSQDGKDDVDAPRGTAPQTLHLTTHDGDEALRLVGTTREHVFSDEYNRKLRRKIDWRIPPLCAMVYFCQFLDKTSLNYASIMGLPLKGQSYNSAALIFYGGFLVWEIPTNFIAQRLPLAKYLGANIILWGIVLALHATAKTTGPFLALRFLLGMLESCVAPILISVISMWYRKQEQASRIGVFYVMNGLTQVFGGFVAYGVSFAHVSIATWQLIFIILGALAIIVGIIIVLFLPDSPVRAKFLTEEERVAALERIRDDQGGTENKHFKIDQVVEAFKDPRFYLIILTTLLTSLPNGGLSNFSAIIIKSFGYDSKHALILGTPGGAIASVTTIICAWLSDAKGERMLPIIIALLPTIVGSALLVGLKHPKGALLFGMWIVQCFGSALSIIYAWNASNIAGYTKKITFNVALMMAFCVGNMVGTEMFLPSDAPTYIPGKIGILVLLSVEVFVCILMRWINVRMNKTKQKKIANLIERNGWSPEDVQKERDRRAFADMTDMQNEFFKYTN